MNYNICVIQPKGYPHSAAFAELAESICYSLRELGYDAQLRCNKLDSDGTNILIGCHLLDTTFIGKFPKSTIVFNTEQIYNDTTRWNKIIFEWVRNFPAWDYSERNIEKFHELGLTQVRHFCLGFQKELVRVKKSIPQDIDIVFYGCVNERRKKALEALKAAGYNVQALFSVYGKKRDEFIARSKIVLNLHMYNSQIFEIVRVYYLMINSKAVVAEVNPTTHIDPCYLSGICAAGYDDLTAACGKLLQNEDLRLQLESRAFQTIQALPQAEFTRAVLSPPGHDLPRR